MEIWKDIIGFEGIYQISDLGRVKSLERVIMRSDGKPYPVRQRIIAVNKYFDSTGNGYLGVCLIFKGKRKTKHIHRLMAESFLSNPNNHPQLNHIDGNKFNNVLSNLEWCTASENVKHAYRTGLKLPTRLSKTHLKEFEIREIKRLAKNKLMRQIDIAKKYKCSVATVSSIKNGTRHGNI